MASRETDFSLVGLAALAFTACGSDGAQAMASPPGSPSRSAGHERPISAALSEVHGDVRWQRLAEAAWVAAHRGLALRAGDSVQTMESSTAVVRFEGSGNLARLDPLTTLRIPDQSPQVARLRHLAGRLVARIPDGGVGSMEVELPPGTLLLTPARPDRAGAGRSIEAQIEVSGARTAVAMVHGEGRLNRSRGGAVDVNEDRFVEVGADGELLEAGRMGERAVPLAPADGATLRTRRNVRFTWAKVPGVDGVRLSIRDENGEERRLALGAAQTEAAVELRSGTYRWAVAGQLAGEALPSSSPRTVEVEVDVTPPPLHLEAPIAGSSVAGAVVRVAGRTEPGAKIEVDGRSVEADTAGVFSTSMQIPRGLTNIVVVVTDDLGNSQAVSRTVLRE